MPHTNEVAESSFLHLDEEPPSTMIASSSLPDATTTALPTYFRTLSDNESSYFLQSRFNGANDMILEVEFRAPAVLISHHRMSLVWAILRVQHPLVASRVEMDAGDYKNCRFVYDPPPSPSAAYTEAGTFVEFQWRSPNDHLHEPASQGPGERRLTPQNLTYIVVQSRAGDIRPVREYRMFFHFAHYSMDGVCTHMLLNMFYALLGGSAVPGQPPRSDEDLEEMLRAEWGKRWGCAGRPGVGMGTVIPVCAEERLPQIEGKWKVVAARIEHTARQKRVIGGHSFPRKAAATASTASRLYQYSVADSTLMLSKCRAQGVSITNAMFALSSMAWIRMMRRASNSPSQFYNPKLPIMIYSAVSLRHLTTPLDAMEQPSALLPPEKKLESWMYLALSYFNAVLPGFIPSAAYGDVERERGVMWHRARVVKDQFARFAGSTMFVPRVHCTAVERGERARRFAKEDDEALMKEGAIKAASSLAVQISSSSANPPPQSPSSSPASPASSPSAASKPTSSVSQPAPSTTPPTPSVALLGLSQLGDLDQYYNTRLYPSIDMHYIQGHTRKNKGGILLFTHTLRGKLALQLSWDENGFQPGVVEAYWQEVKDCVREYLVDGEVGKVKL